MMKLHKTYPIWLGLSILILAILACGPNPVQPVSPQVTPAHPTPGLQNSGLTQQPSGPPTVTTKLSDMYKATVQIYGLFNVNGELKPKYSGSGALINSTGMILTTATVASPAAWGAPDLEPDALAIGLFDQIDRPTVLLYLAKVKAVDGYLDLAVIQIASTMDGTNVDSNSLNLPFVPLGNPDDLHIGDHIDIFGFPPLGGDPITYTDSHVAGFSPQEGLGDHAWIRTDEDYKDRISGGLAADVTGSIIGVTSTHASGGGTAPADCRRIQDTNGDGVIDDKDICIGSMGPPSIRPINFALPLIKAVEAGEPYVSPFDAPAPSP